jgi:hypothetical protein
LPPSGVSLQNIGFLIEISHFFNDFIVSQLPAGPVEEPRRIVLKLRIGVTEELEVKVEEFDALL